MATAIKIRSVLTFGYCRRIEKKFTFSIPEPIVEIIITYQPCIDSCILDTVELQSKFFEYVLEKKFVFKKNAGEYIRRIFNAKTDGFSAQHFHAKCDGIKNTLTIAISEHGNIYGGFASIAWQSQHDNTYLMDETAFIFQLQNKMDTNITEPIVYELKNKNDTYAVIQYIDHGPSFGAGCDIWITNQCNVNRTNHCCPHSFDIPDNKFLAGSSKFNIINYEVFQILNLK
eukprot:100966_1